MTPTTVDQSEKHDPLGLPTNIADRTFKPSIFRAHTVAHKNMALAETWIGRDAFPKHLSSSLHP